jgi:tRNA1Val (adenine37-N6)-methyltransferase
LRKEAMLSKLMLLKLTKAPMNKQQIISKTPWSDRLFCYHAGLDEFVEEPEDEYDLIVSNPPTEDYKTDNEQRDLALSRRYAFEDLIEAVDLFLSENGIFAVIIPLKKKKISWP